MLPGVSIPAVDLPMELPVAAGNGALIVNDPRGTDPYLYVLLGLSDFWRIDTRTWTAQQLASPPVGGVFGAMLSGCYDPSRGRIWVISAGSVDDAWFHFFDLATATWDAGGAPGVASLNTLLSGALITGSALAHPCTDVAFAGSDTHLYLTCDDGPSQIACYHYNIGATTWTAVAVRFQSMGAGVSLDWPWAYSIDTLVSLPGGNNGNIELYEIGGDAWGAGAGPLPAFDPTSPGLGTATCVHPSGDSILLRLNATGRVYRYRPVDGTIVPVAKIHSVDGAATGGHKLAAYTANGKVYAVVLVHGSTSLQRLELVPGV